MKQLGRNSPPGSWSKKLKNRKAVDEVKVIPTVVTDKDANPDEKAERLSALSERSDDDAVASP